MPRMDNSAFTSQHDFFRKMLVEMRNEAELTQRELAARLGREHNFVARIELGERRVDVVEFYWVCLACGADPIEMAATLMKEFAKIDRKKSK